MDQIDFFHTKGVGAFHGKLEANELYHMILLWFRLEKLTATYGNDVVFGPTNGKVPNFQ